jgi:hypothetical protein
MAEFIDTESGYVNLDHVATVERSRAGKSSLLRDRKGRSLGVARGEVSQSYTLIAAAPGMFATAIDLGNDHSVRPVADDVFVERYPIVAWRIRGGEDLSFAFPVLAGVHGDNETVLLELPDGRFDLRMSGTYDGIEVAKAEILAVAQNNWDRTDRLRREAKESRAEAKKARAELDYGNPERRGE